MTTDPMIHIQLSFEAAANIHNLVLDRLRENDRIVSKKRAELGEEEFAQWERIWDMPHSTRRGYESFLDQCHDRWPEEFPQR